MQWSGVSPRERVAPRAERGDRLVRGISLSEIVEFGRPACRVFSRFPPLPLRDPRVSPSPRSRTRDIMLAADERVVHDRDGVLINGEAANESADRTGSL